MSSGVELMFRIVYFDLDLLILVIALTFGKIKISIMLVRQLMIGWHETMMFRLCDIGLARPTLAIVGWRTRINRKQKNILSARGVRNGGEKGRMFLGNWK